MQNPIPTPLRVGDRVIRISGPDFAPGRVCEILPPGLIIGVAYAGGSRLFAPADGFRLVPASYRPPLSRRLTEVQQVELMYDSEIPPCVLEAAEAVDATPTAIETRRRIAAADRAWRAAHLDPLLTPPAAGGRHPVSGNLRPSGLVPG